MAVLLLHLCSDLAVSGRNIEFSLCWSRLQQWSYRWLCAQGNFRSDFSFSSLTFKISPILNRWSANTGDQQRGLLWWLSQPLVVLCSHIASTPLNLFILSFPLQLSKDLHPVETTTWPLPFFFFFISPLLTFTSDSKSGYPVFWPTNSTLGFWGPPWVYRTQECLT